MDREAGTCSFDDPSFRSMLEFIQTFPTDDEVNKETAGLGDAWDALIEEARARQRKGLQLLEELTYLSLDRLAYWDALWGGRCAFVGYPVEDGSVGSMFRPGGPQLGISSSCGNKEAAWEFVRTVMTNLSDSPMAPALRSFTSTKQITPSRDRATRSSSPYRHLHWAARSSQPRR